MRDSCLPDDLVIQAEHCGQPLVWRGSGIRWHGIEEHSQRRMACANCGLRVVISVTDLDPLPTGDAP